MNSTGRILALALVLISAGACMSDEIPAVYHDSDVVRQIISVRHTGGSNAVVKMFERGPSSNGRWKKTLSCEAFIGKNGMGKEKEGDGKTPSGDYGIITAFGIKPNPGTTLPYVDVTDDIWCCGDSAAYNRIIDLKELPHECKGEHMIDFNQEYAYGFFLDYNKECTFGRGSAIFFHCTGEKPYTAGCIAVSEQDMIAILQAIDIDTRIIISKNK